MAEPTQCPACGAPLETSGDTGDVRCQFCGALVHVNRDGDQVSFSVTSQGSGPSQPVAEQNFGMESPTMPEPPDAGGALVYGSEPAPTPPAEGYAAPAGPIPPAPYAVDSVPPPRPANRNWIWIVVAIVAGLCLLCACSAVVAMLAYRSR